MGELHNILGLGNEQTWRYIGQLADFFGATLPILTGILILVGYWKRKKIRQFFSRGTFSDVGEEMDEHEQFDAVLFTVSHEEISRIVIEMTKPKIIGLIPTGGSQTSAEKIKSYAESKNIRVLEISEIADANNPAHAQKAAKRLLSFLKDTDHARIAIDVTGGKTPMSIGAFMAAHEAGVTTIYLKSEFDKNLNKIKPGTARLVRISAG